MAGRSERIVTLLEKWHARDLAGVVAMLTPDFEYRTGSAHATSPDAPCAMARQIWAATPDEKVEIVSIVEQGSAVAVEARTTATHSGTLSFGGVTLPPTGRALDIMSAWFFTFEGDLIARWHEYGSLKQWVEQMGATVTIMPLVSESAAR